MAEQTTLGSQASQHDGEGAPDPLRPALVLVWAARAPTRLGEALVLPRTAPAPCVFGRGGAKDDDRYERLLLTRQRPGANVVTSPIEDPFLSRQQLKLVAEGAGVRVENDGRRPLLVDGRETDAAVVSVGQTIEIKNLLLFACVLRPATLPPLAYAAKPSRPFGEADEHGMVGESASAWELRDRVAFAGGRGAHVLVTGESGTGKELVAQAIHALSARRGARLVSRNAATLPSGLIDAELFGNVASYPHAGLPERRGMIGEADGSTLFLDEIGELPAEMQTHLLRVLDEHGEYQRLGEGRARRADLRLVAATNRAAAELKHDLLARLPLRLHVPGLRERREDIPLLARHCLSRIAAKDAQIGARFFDAWDGRRGEPRISAALMRGLLLHEYRTHVRELESLLWRSLLTSKGAHAELTEEVSAELSPRAEDAAPARELDAEEIRAALAKHGGVKEKVWRELGLPSRHALNRLMKKRGLEPGS